MDTIDLAANPQTRQFGGVSFNYYPVIVTGNIAAFYPHSQLPYGDRYSVTMDPGVITDQDGAPFVGFADRSFWNFTVQPSAPPAGTGELTVAFDSGNFCTVQGAVDFVPPGNAQPVVISVRRGTFTGITYVPANKPFLTVFGSADPVATRTGAHLQFQQRVPGAQGLDHVMIEGANHFIQEDAHAQIVDIIHQFVSN